MPMMPKIIPVSDQSDNLSIQEEGDILCHVYTVFSPALYQDVVTVRV